MPNPTSVIKINDNEYTLKDAAAESEIISLDTRKENVANKVTSIDSDSTNTEYPSAKCVYDAINANPLFYPTTYQVSTCSDVYTAIQAGKIPICEREGRIYILAQVVKDAQGNLRWIDLGSAFYGDYGTFARLRLFPNDNWSIVTMNQNNNINASSTNTQFPGSKTVYDFVTGIADNKQNKLYKHAIGFNRATGSTVELFSIKIFLTRSHNDVINTPAGLLDVMTTEYGANTNIPASGYFFNTDSEIIQVLHINANPYAYGGIGAFNAYGINESTGLYEGREFINAGTDIDVSDTVTGV